ncbi:LysR family transcriptional regulator [Lichenicoccus sp.]|uniref:LysR family transcriptional regulator n=1 Tax=Lichenicoccus sp. TaxID=2781899 RepID=UPI003D0F292D
MTIGTPTLDQLQVFVAVVEAGSFAQAARSLNRATSVVSYTIATLEAQLGIGLFTRAGTRRPVLTDAGRSLLADARLILDGLDGLRAKARGLESGLEAEVGLAVDVMLPTHRLVDALKAFQDTFPTVTLRLHVEALGGVMQMVLDGRARVGVSGPLNLQGHGLESTQIGEIDLIPVAAPDHPLAASGPRRGARHHVQLVLSDRSPLTEGQEFAVVGTRTWRLADLGSKHALLLAGIGWGNMPALMVQDDLDTGRLVRLHLADLPPTRYRFSAIHRTDCPPGPAASWLIRRLALQG